MPAAQTAARHKARPPRPTPRGRNAAKHRRRSSIVPVAAQARKIEAEAQRLQQTHLPAHDKAAPNATSRPRSWHRAGCSATSNTGSCASRSGSAAPATAVSALSPTSASRPSINVPARAREFDRETAQMFGEPRPPLQRARVLPGCSVGLARREAPPRTNPRWRPCARVNASRIAPLSPCGRTERTMASSDHSMRRPTPPETPAPFRDNARACRPSPRAL